MKRWGWTPQGMCVSEREELQFVYFSDYTKLVDALRLTRRQGTLPDQEIAEAALLSAGERL